MSEIVSVSFEEEAKKNPELKKSDIKLLKEWMKKQPHLPKISDSSLALFLHRNYYHIEPTKSTIDNYYTLRTHLPQFFGDRDPLGCKELREAFLYTTVLSLEQTTKEGYDILFVNFDCPDPSKLVFSRFVKFIYMVLDLWIYRSGTTKGYLIVFDVKKVKDFSFGYVTRFHPIVLKKFLFYLQDGLPVRLKGLHYVNVTPAMDAIFKLVKLFLKKDIMLHMHSSLESLNEFVPIEVLPSEYGGKAGPMIELHEAQIKELERHRDWFLEEEERSKVDENKRPAKEKSISEIFGVEGSFKKLHFE